MSASGRWLAIAAGVLVAADTAAGQRYATAAAAITPVPMASSCAAPAAAQVDAGAAWLLVLEPDQARAAFDRAADLDPDCALAYWGRSLARFDAAAAPAAETSAAAIAAVLADISRAASVPARTAFERAAVAALQRLASREAAPGLPAAWPAGSPRIVTPCAGRRRRTIWCARALASSPGPSPGEPTLAWNVSWSWRARARWTWARR